MGCHHEISNGRGVTTVINAGGLAGGCSFCREEKLLAENAAHASRIVFLEEGITRLIEHHEQTAHEEQQRIDEMPTTLMMRERLIGKVKIRRLIAGKLRELQVPADSSCKGESE